MEQRDILKEHIHHLLTEDCVYSKRVSEVFNVPITTENISDLEKLINLLEIHEGALREIRQVLQLKQQSHLMKYMAAYAKNMNM
jgi:hypothetical protein